MFKLLGSAIIIISSYMLGYLKSCEYVKRVKYLESMHSCVVQAENEIRYIQTPILDVFKKVSVNAAKPIRILFDDAINIVVNFPGQTICNAWQKSVENNSVDFNKKDREVLLSFDSCLGNNDIAGQLKCFLLYEKNLEDAISDAKLLSEKNTKLFKCLGLYSGILITVLLI